MAYAMVDKTLFLDNIPSDGDEALSVIGWPLWQLGRRGRRPV
jgi:hypothetical protein